MSVRPIDLRSDTVTQPDAGMRAAMASAEVGDDVIDVDPTVQRLQQAIAASLGKEAALFMPSGTMTNQVAVRLHCRGGDELICEGDCHLFHYEQGGFAQLSQVVARTIAGRGGEIELDQLGEVLRPDNEHATRSRLFWLENTHNRAGGVVLDYANLAALCAWAAEHGLRRHLDGARLFNAAVASGIPVDRWAAPFDTVSVCFSKGLGAPVGSALAGPRDAVVEMRRHRKLFGGGMRQAGIIAAGALYALQHNVPRLADDHRRARRLAERLAESPQLEVDLSRVQTNIVLFSLRPAAGPASAFCQAAREAGVWILPFGGPRVRAVTHLHLGDEEIDRAADVLRRLAEERACRGGAR